MIALIEAINNTSQSVDILPENDLQEIDVENVEIQNIDIEQDDEAQEIEIETECTQKLAISYPCPAKIDLQIAIKEKVPKALSILPQATSAQFETSAARGVGRVYLDGNGTPCFATLEQIKAMNTKVVCVEAMSDEIINRLSEGDIILLKER